MGYFSEFFLAICAHHVAIFVLIVVTKSTISSCYNFFKFHTLNVNDDSHYKVVVVYAFEKKLNLMYT